MVTCEVWFVKARSKQKKYIYQTKKLAELTAKAYKSTLDLIELAAR